MMTGRDLIVYILENGLEDKPVFEDGDLLGFKNIVEVAEEANVGIATILAWLNMGKIEGITIGDTVYIPAIYDPYDLQTEYLKERLCGR